MRVGVDLDNTIVCYDDVFHRVAVEWGLIPANVAVSKGAVRDYLRRQGREDTWIELQGYVYGNRFREAQPFPGVTNSSIAARSRRSRSQSSATERVIRLQDHGTIFIKRRISGWRLMDLPRMARPAAPRFLYTLNRPRP